MTMLTILQPTLAASWYEALLNTAILLGLPTTDWTDYSPERNILTITARGLEGADTNDCERARGAWLSYATGEALSILAVETYRSPRLPATFATCVGTFTNSGAVTRTIDAGDYVTVKPSDRDDIRYRVDGPLSIPPGDTAGVVVRAETAGSVGSAAPGEIDAIEGSALPDVSFENTSAATGRDEETDADLQDRARLGVTALAIAGPDGAYAYFARGGERDGEIDTTIAAIGVTRVRVVTDLADGGITAYYATASGPVGGGDVDLINAKLLLRVVGSGRDFTGLSANPVEIDIEGTVYVPDNLGVDEAGLKAAITARITAYLQSPIECPIGGPPEIVPTPGYTGSITVSKTRGLLTEAEVNGLKPVTNAVHTVNLSGEQLLEQGDVPVVGTIAITVVYQSPQTP